MKEEKENRINVEDLQQGERELTDDEARDVQGGMLLPAIQSAREAARTSTSTSTGNVVQGNLIGTDVDG